MQYHEVHQTAKSHPTWVRGLKLSVLVVSTVVLHVAPHVGAWIEISTLAINVGVHMSHPTWVRGLKFLSLTVSVMLLSRTPRGCVD